MTSIDLLKIRTRLLNVCMEQTVVELNGRSMAIYWSDDFIVLRELQDAIGVAIDQLF